MPLGGFSVFGEVRNLPGRFMALERLVGRGSKASLYICRQNGITNAGLIYRSLSIPDARIIFERLLIGFGFEDLSPSFRISGRMLLTLENSQPLAFLLECDAKPGRLTVEGVMESEYSGFTLFGRFTVLELGILLEFGNGGLTLGLMGGFKFNSLVFHGFASCKLDGTVKPAAFMAAFAEMNLVSIIGLFTGDSPELFDEFDFLVIENLGCAACPELESSEPAKVANVIRRVVSNPAFAPEADDIYIRSISGGFLISDLKNARSYLLMKRRDSGYDLTLPPQFYLNITGDGFRFGRYNIPPGMFLCAAATILGTRTALAFQINEGGVSLYHRVNTINLRHIRISASERAYPENDPLDAAAQFLSRDKSGPALYVRIGRDCREAVLDAKIDVFGIFGFSARLFFRGGRVETECLLSQFYGLANVWLRINAGREDFATSRFTVVLCAELSNFREELAKSVETSGKRGLLGPSYLKKIEVEIGADGHDGKGRINVAVAVDFVLFGRPFGARHEFKLDLISKLAKKLKEIITKTLKSAKTGNLTAMDSISPECECSGEEFLVECESLLGSVEPGVESFLISNYFALDFAEQRTNAFLETLEQNDYGATRLELLEQKNKLAVMKEKMLKKYNQLKESGVYAGKD